MGPHVSGRGRCQRELARGAAGRHEARRELQHQREIARARQALERLAGRRLGNPHQLPRPLSGMRQRVPERRVQRIGRGEGLAALARQAVEGAIAVGFAARHQGIGQKAGDAERLQ